MCINIHKLSSACITGTCLTRAEDIARARSLLRLESESKTRFVFDRFRAVACLDQGTAARHPAIWLTTLLVVLVVVEALIVRDDEVPLLIRSRTEEASSTPLEYPAFIDNALLQLRGGLRLPFPLYLHFLPQLLSLLPLKGNRFRASVTPSSLSPYAESNAA